MAESEFHNGIHILQSSDYSNTQPFLEAMAVFNYEVNEGRNEGRKGGEERRSGRGDEGKWEGGREEGRGKEKELPEKATNVRSTKITLKVIGRSLMYALSCIHLYSWENCTRLEEIGKR